MTTPLDTKHWAFAVKVGFIPKQINTKECLSCLGHGRFGGFKSLDGYETCNECRGSGVVDEEQREDAPKIPEELASSLKETIKKYFELLEKDSK